MELRSIDASFFQEWIALDYTLHFLCRFDENGHLESEVMENRMAQIFRETRWRFLSVHENDVAALEVCFDATKSQRRS